MTDPVIVLANWFDPRLIRIFGLDTDAGTIIFPLTFLLSDLITEVYGYKYARRAIWCGFLFNILFIIYGQIVIHMPSPHYQTNNKMFDSLLLADTRIILASSISYFSSEPLNSFVMAKLKIKMKGRYMGIRFILSTFLASGTDSVIFSIIAFYGTINYKNLIYLILTMWLIKVMIELIGLPFSIRISKKLKISEKMDIYDKRTKFNMVSLGTCIK
ncbi:MAG: queuosine precursor transporter [Gammaproteobacteria bacterium]|nr:queuosine precursor transporter [Gammaproteobacteria bacterium]